MALKRMVWRKRYRLLRITVRYRDGVLGMKKKPVTCPWCRSEKRHFEGHTKLGVLLREGGRFHRRTSLDKSPVWQERTERYSHLEEVSPALWLEGMWAGLAGKGVSREHPETRRPPQVLRGQWVEVE